MQIGENEMAAVIAEEYLALVDDHLPKNSNRLATHLTLICSQYFLQIEDFEEAEKHLRRAARIWHDQDPDGWRTLRTKSLLGEALAGQAKFAKAEELILYAYDGLARSKGSIPEIVLNKIPRSIERLIELYEASDESSSKPNSQRIIEQLRQKLSEFRIKDESNETIN